MLRSIRWVTLAFLLLVPAGFQAQNTKSVVLEALRAEMARSLEHFKKMPNPPYFLSYEVVETEEGGDTPVGLQRGLIDVEVHPVDAFYLECHVFTEHFGDITW